MKKYYLIYSCFLLLIFSFLTLIMGDIPLDIAWPEAIERLKGISNQWNPILDERLPRLIVILCTGASLAVSGAIMQSLFHNPLASPSVLGITSGGCLLVVMVYILNLQISYPYTIPLAAIAGCFLTLCLVHSISCFQQGMPLNNLILTGIAISTIFLSIQGVFLYALRDHWQLIQTITEWEAGSTLDRSWDHVHMQLPLTIVGLAGSYLYRKEMNLLALGEEEAKNLGVDTERIRWRLFFCVALLTGASLAAVGMITFFGLVLPHILRRLQGPDHRSLIPFCIVGGAMALIFLDLLLRTFNVYAISIGNLSAILGGLFFLILLFQSQREKSTV